jgi:hypothetical protein
VLILCEGTVTEPGYLQDFGREQAVRLLDIEVDDSGGTPKTLVERAAERMRSSRRRAKRGRTSSDVYDEIWCVFDVDEHPRLAEAKQQARANGIGLAISNPCFELWVLLHFQDQTAYVERGAVQRACREHIPSYEKRIPYDLIRDKYGDALKRASRLDHGHRQLQQEGENPSTAVPLLTERLRQLGRDSFLASIPR